MKQLFIFAALVFMIWACGNSSDNSSSSNPTPKASTPEPVAQIDGKKLYRQKCVTCHGIKGNLTMNGAKDLTVSEMSQADRELIITQGKGVMTPFEGQLSAEEIAAVAKYTFELKQ